MASPRSRILVVEAEFEENQLAPESALDSLFTVISLTVGALWSEPS